MKARLMETSYPEGTAASSLKRAADERAGGELSSRTICHVFDFGAATGASFVPLVAALSREVTSRGDRFVAFGTEVPGATWPADLRLAGAELHLVRSDAEVVEGLRAARPDIVHTHFTRYDLPALRGAPHARIFWHVHSHREDLSAKARIRAFLKYRILGRRVEAVIAISEVIREECIAWFTPADRLRLVYNAIDPEHFHPATPQERAAARGQFGIVEGDRVVLFFERRPYKGGATLREALWAPRTAGIDGFWSWAELKRTGICSEARRASSRSSVSPMRETSTGLPTLWRFRVTTRPSEP
jgi:uncharacterized protein (DUF1810 family)